MGDLASDISTVEAEGKTNDDHNRTKIIKEEETEEIEERKQQKLEPDKGDATTVAAVIAEGNLAIPAQETETEESLEEAQVVPVWEPDTQQQDDQIAPVTQSSAPQQKRDNNVNEVCPWEDE